MSFARVRALVVVGVLAVAAIVFVVVAVVRDSQAGQQVAENCPAGWVRADIRLPEPKEVKIKVLNGTNRDGLGIQVTEEFRNRKFVTEKPDDNAKAVNGIAVLRYGPKAVGSAHLLRAYFLDEAETAYDAKRDSEVVDVAIGPQFQQLATTTEVNQSLAALGQPQLPEESCPAEQA